MIAWDRFKRFRRTKAYDVIAAAPLIAYVGYGGWTDVSNVGPALQQAILGTTTLLGLLQTIAQVSSAVFCGLLVVFLLVRTPPVARAPGIVPRALAVTGTFIAGAYLYLTPVTLPLWLQVVAVTLIVVTTILEVLVLVWLGKSFAIMAEARALVTNGPYALARHPLYSIEIFGTLAMVIQFFSWQAVALFVAFSLIQIARSIFEERILGETFPEYGAFCRRTARFVPFIC